MEDEPMFEILEKQELILRMRSSVDSVAAQLNILHVIIICNFVTITRNEYLTVFRCLPRRCSVSITRV